MHFFPKITKSLKICLLNILMIDCNIPSHLYRCMKYFDKIHKILAYSIFSIEVYNITTRNRHTGLETIRFLSVFCCLFKTVFSFYFVHIFLILRFYSDSFIKYKIYTSTDYYFFYT